MGECIACYDLWSWNISSRSFSNDFAIKLINYGTSCHVCSTACTVLDGFFPCLAQMITSMIKCVPWDGLTPWPISSRSFSHDLSIKPLKYGTSCCIHFTAWAVLDGLFPNLAQMITNMKWYVAHSDLWAWPISSRSLSHDFANKTAEMLHILSTLLHVQFWVNSLLTWLLCYVF